jgi:hypothetical protein
MAVFEKDPQTAINDTSFGDLSWSNVDNVKTSNNAYATVSLAPTQLWSNIYTYTTNSTHASVTNWVGQAISTKPILPNTIENKTASIVNTTYNGKTALTYVYIQSNAVFPNQMVKFFNGCSNLTEVSQIPNSVADMSSTFYSCSNLVNAPVIPNSVTNMSYTFRSCSKLVNAPVIPNSVTDISYTFQFCSNLTEVSQIPNSVTNMSYTFYSCSKLVNAPVIPNSVTNMSRTFYSCSNLVNAPVIPNSVTDMRYTFHACSKLVNAPVIGSNVVNMNSSFYNCTNLIGDITLVNANITNLTNCFYGTNASKPKTLYVPAGSATYNLAIAQCDGKNGVTVVAY